MHEPTISDAIAPTSPDVIQRLVAHHRKFLGFLERRLGNRALAEDILQDAFVRGVSKLDTLNAEELVVPWFYRILKNAVIDQQRKQAVAHKGLEKLAHQLDPTSEAEPELMSSVCSCVSELASTLKPEYAAALQRVELDGLSLTEYAEEAGITSGNARVRVFRAREALKRQVSRACGTCADHGCLDCTCQSSCKKSE